MRFTRSLLALAAAAVTVAMPTEAAEPAGYRVVSSIKTDGQGAIQGLRVDQAARRLYVARAGAVEVVDIDSDKKVGQVAVKGGATAVAVASDLRRGFAASASDNSITIFDLSTLQVLKTVKSTGTEPSALEYEPVSKRVFVANARDGKLTVLGAESGDIVGSIALGGKLRGIGSDTRGDVFVADVERNVLHVVRTKDLSSRGSIATWPATKPTALTVDDKERRIYVSTGSGRLVVIDPDIGQMVGYVPIGSGDAGIAAQYAPNRFVRLFVPSADGALTVVQNAKLTASVESKLPSSGSRSTAVAVDGKSGRAYLAGGSEVLVLNK
ncbi:hypothetical protein P3W85_43420 [Cupriavidus basilensis]|uniref:YncE family protein n=1 Tax=Cupriavidus basilensis TaxID=68895 RepID=A0ABT6B6H4_9BURK|nr:hypothetical protein [Cupriavidus basilensis]MDF3839741.1 hypothetical protein [Cupriavidus basilensis]